MTRFLNALVLLLVAIPAAAQVSVKMTADNYFAVYTGTPTAATTMQFNGAWPAVSQPPPFTAAPLLYVVAWDDGSTYQGLLGSVTNGTGYVTTGSPLWQVCKANQTLPGGSGGAPSVAALTAAIVAQTAPTARTRRITSGACRNPMRPGTGSARRSCSGFLVPRASST